MASKISLNDAADPVAMPVNKNDNGIFWDVYNQLARDPQTKRREEINHYAEHPPTSPLGPNGRLYEGTWLKTHFADLAQAGSSDNSSITQIGLIDTFAKGSWSNGVKLSADDQYMLKRTVSHFDELSSRGGAIEKKDLEALLQGAKITKGPDGLITSVYPDGKVVRSIETNVWTKEKDGTQKIEFSPNMAGSVTIIMKADGTGTLNVPDADALPLVRKPGDIWQMTDPKGNTVDFHFDQTSGKVSTSDGLEVSMGGEGGSIHDTHFPDDQTHITLGSDAKIVSIVDNKPVTIDETKEGVRYVRNEDGSLELDYGGEACVSRDAKGNLFFESGHTNFPRVSVDKNGDMEVLDSSGKAVQMYLDVDTGEQHANVGETAEVRRSKDGTLKISYLPDDNQPNPGEGLFTWKPNFEATTPTVVGDAYTYKPPRTADLR